MATLKDVLPHEAAGGAYAKDRIASLLEVEVTSRHELASKPWPGPHRNVFNWYALANGRAVGWNENPARGWSFPVIRYTPAT